MQVTELLNTCALCGTPLDIKEQDSKHILVVIETSQEGRARVITLHHKELHRCPIPKRGQ